MNSSGEAAESVVKMSLQGLEVATKITGSGVKQITALLIAMLKDKRKTKGKSTLTNMLKSGKELKVFTVKEEDLKKFTEEAKRYGVLFCVLKDKRGRSHDGMVDIMVRAEDAGKINRIVERFKLVDTATIKSNIEKTKEDKTNSDEDVVIKSVEEILADDILSKPVDKEDEILNPQEAVMEKSPLSEPISKNKKEMGTKSEKPSVREKIKKIKRELAEKENPDLDKNNISKSKVEKGKTSKKTKTKGKKTKVKGGR